MIRSLSIAATLAFTVTEAKGTEQFVQSSNQPDRLLSHAEDFKGRTHNACQQGKCHKMKIVPRYDFYSKGVIRKLFRSFDTNRNYVITRSEIRKQFQRWDRNNDSSISAAEMENSTYGHHKNLCSRVGPLKGYYHSDHGRRLQKRRHNGFFNIFDTDSSGGVKLQEFEKALLSADIKNNGRITGVDWEFFFNVHVSAICSESDWQSKDVVAKRAGQTKGRQGSRPPMVSDSVYQQTVRKAFADVQNGGQISRLSAFKRFFFKLKLFTPLKFNDSDFVWRDAFRLFDKNQDSKITFEEAWMTLANSKVQVSVKIMDRMSAKQFMNAARILYGRADTNNDRMVKYSEFVALFKQVHPKADTRGWTQSQWKNLFKKYDANGDSIITWKEFWVVSRFRSELKKRKALVFSGVGKLLVTVVEAKLTRDTEFFGKMDPKVTVSYPFATQTKSWSTKELVNAGKNPVWKESVSVDVKSLSGYLLMTVYDVDVFNNEQVGTVTVQLADLCKDMEKVDKWFTLTYKGKSAGQLRIAAVYKPNQPPKRKPTPKPKPAPRPTPNRKKLLPKITPGMPLADFKRVCYYYFGVFDRKPRNGLLNLREFRNTYLKVLPTSPMKKATKWSQVQKVMDAYDTNGDAQVSWEEFWAITKFREKWDSKDFKKHQQNQAMKNKLPVITMEMSNADYKSACIVIFKAYAGKNGSTPGIDFTKFKDYYKKVRPWTSFTSRTSDKSWRRMFRVYDIDGNGFVFEKEAWTRLKRN